MLMNNIHEILGYPLFFVAGIELLLGFILLRQNPGNSLVNKTAATLAFFSALFAFTTGIMYIRASLGLSISLVARLNWIGWFTLPSALQFLYYLGDEKSRSAKRIVMVLYPFWTIVLLLAVFTDLIVNDSYVPLPYHNEPGPLENPLRLFGVLLVLWTLYKVVDMRRTATGIARKELNYFCYGLLLFAGGAGITSGLMQLFGGFGFEPGLGAYFGLPWVLLTFYSIARYNLFDVRLIISRLLGIIVLLMLFSALQTGVHALFQPMFGDYLSIFFALPIIAFFFFGTPFSRRLQDGLDSIILKDRVNYQPVLRNFIDSIASLLDLDRILQLIQTTVRTGVGSEIACVYMADTSGTYREHALPEARSERVLPDAAVLWIQKTKSFVLRVTIETLLPAKDAADLVAILRDLSAEVLIPIFSQGKLRGVLCLGARMSRRPYTQTDIQFLETLAGQAAVAIENATLFKETSRIKGSLLESEGKFRVLAETIPAAVFIHKGERFLYANPASAVLFGHTPEEILTMELAQVVHPDFRENVLHHVLAHIEGRESGYQTEFKIIRKGGEERWVIMSTGVMDFQGARAIISTLFDITARKDLEGKVSYMRRMEALGKLAGGVAHDFNNILSSIVGHGSILEMKLLKDDPLQKHVSQILSSTERASSLTQRLMNYGARKDLVLSPCDLNELMTGQDKFLAGILREDIKLTIKCSMQPLTVLADNRQIERIIMNLVANARDAMPDGGTITINTGRMVLDSDFIRDHGFGKAGTYAFFSIQDTGSGMAPGVQKRIFEPFFTTKGVGKGTGFGLSIVYDIIKDHSGYINVESIVGSGTAFTVYLPLVDASPAAAAQALHADLKNGNGIILLAEDDDEIRKFARTVLEEYGYTVLEARDGEEALQAFDASKDDIRGVLTDIIMPRMNGRELVAAIRKVRSDLPILYMSGYSEELLLKTGLLQQGQSFLFKPASRHELVAKVQTMLGGS